MALGSSLMMSQLTVEPLIVALPSSCRCCVAICYAAADFFQNISGDPSNTASVFLTSTYGPLADKWQSNIGLYNYALFFIGSQPAGAGTPFLPQDALTTAVDWSPFSPHAAGWPGCGNGMGPDAVWMLPEDRGRPAHPNSTLHELSLQCPTIMCLCPGRVIARYDLLHYNMVNAA